MGTSLQIHDRRILERCLKDWNISEENRKALNEFDAFLKAVQRRVGTRKNYILVAWQLANRSTTFISHLANTAQTYLEKSWNRETVS